MFLFQAVTLIAAVLVVWAGLYARSQQIGEASARRWLYFLLITMALLVSLSLFDRLLNLNSLTSFLMPVGLGVLAALYIELGADNQARLSRTQRAALLLLATVLQVAQGISMRDNSLVYIISLAGYSLIIALIWRGWGWLGRHAWLPVLGVVCLLLGMAAWSLYSNLIIVYAPSWLQTILSLIYLWPVLAVAWAARLLLACLMAKEVTAWRAVGVIAMLAASIGLLAWQIADAAPLDQATDGLAGIFLYNNAVWVAIACGMLLAWDLPGARRGWGLFYVLMVAIPLAFAFLDSWRTPVTPPQLSDARAARIDQAIQQYYVHYNRYPSKLLELVPAELLIIPQPVIFHDQTWCYQGGRDFYRLGYVHRPNFGVPPPYITIRISASNGAPPNPDWECDAALEKAREQATGISQ